MQDKIIIAKEYSVLNWNFKMFK